VALARTHPGGSVENPFVFFIGFSLTHPGSSPENSFVFQVFALEVAQWLLHRTFIPEVSSRTQLISSIARVSSRIYKRVLPRTFFIRQGLSIEVTERALWMERVLDNNFYLFI